LTPQGKLVKNPRGNWNDKSMSRNELVKYIEENNVKNHMFLFCAGPFSNILIHECFKISSNNTYLDMGSTLDSMMSLGETRGYLRGADTLNKVCIW
jgi:hypothetical protein